MKRRSYLIIILSITLLLATISVSQARGPRKGGCNGKDAEMGRGLRQRNIDVCLRDLDLSSDQIAQFRKIRDAHIDTMEQIRDDMHKYRAQKRKQLQKGVATDQKSLENLLDEGAKLWKEREMEKMQYRQKISSLLTQEQKDRLYMCETFRPRQGRGPSRGRPVPPER